MQDDRTIRLVLGVVMVIFGIWMLISGIEGLSGSDAVDINASRLMEVTDNKTVRASFFSGGRKLASLELEVANTVQEREEGMMYRKNLAKRKGMIFVWNDSEERAFWMKNTYIPLDMIFVARNGTVLNIEEAEPQPNTSTEKLEIYRSDGSARFVIETNQNFSERYGIKQGTEVDLKISR